MKRLQTAITLAAFACAGVLFQAPAAMAADTQDENLNATSAVTGKLRIATRAGTSPMYSLGGNTTVNSSAMALDDKNWQKGVDLARSALRSKSVSRDTFPLANNNLCIGLTFLQQPDEALPHCNVAVKERPRQWEFYNNRAIAHYYKGDYERSLVDYYLAMTFSGNEEVLLENLHLTLRARAQNQPHTGGPQT